MEDLARLVQRAATGDESAYRDLYGRYRPAVARLVRGFAGLSPDEGEDVIQETFVRAFRALRKLQTAAAFEPWLFAIARNRARTEVDRLSNAARLRQELGQDLDPVFPAIPPGLRREREAEEVRRLIAELPEGPEKQTVTLFYLEGRLSAREIAEQLGLSKSAVTMRLERFRARIKRELLRSLLAAQWE